MTAPPENGTARRKARIKRITVRINSGVRELPTAVWKIEMSAAGLRARKKGEHESNGINVRWRTILGILLVHGMRGPRLTETEDEA